jgi:hypothetical protein
MISLAKTEDIILIEIIHIKDNTIKWNNADNTDKLN